MKTTPYSATKGLRVRGDTSEVKKEGRKIETIEEPSLEDIIRYLMFRELMRLNGGNWMDLGYLFAGIASIEENKGEEKDKLEEMIEYLIQKFIEGHKKRDERK